jgi:organic hydroperoxide reductase OsmC/OhrA
MPIAVGFRRLEGTDTMVGWSGKHTVLADRRDGSAGGRGLGFSGGELQALALGAGYCNQLWFSAAELGIEIETIEVDVTLEAEDDRLTGATIRPRLTSADGVDAVARLLRHATEHSTISNSVAAGFPVAVDPA